MRDIKNKRQSVLTKKYNKLVKLYNHDKNQLEACKEAFKEMKDNRDYSCYQFAYMIHDYSEALMKISSDLKNIKRRIKKSNKNYQIDYV